MSRIYVHRYRLQSRQGLNSRSHTTEHEGALIRVDKDGFSGYGCLHPWVELGDLSLDELLLELKEGRLSRQVKCALHCAGIDGVARSEGVSLFDGVKVPDSHATIVGGIDRVALAVEEGFDTVKMKMGRDLEADIKLVQEVNEAFPDLRLRFDFNGVLSEGQVVKFVDGLGAMIRGQIDFLEDPTCLGVRVWNELRDKYGVKTAVDREVAKASASKLIFDYSVLKPAVNRTDRLCDSALLSGRNVVITSYMDHPLGQCYAALMAGLLDEGYRGLVNKRCGLMTHGLYEADAFTERLGEKSPRWKSPHGGTGLGFDDLLEELDWQEL